ncbi:MAG: MATE family efflux transporter [Albidovulum sp.]|nr:MATE family efflux transporter [Albidovulum sp.]MDE0533600.1 MATE family efflux transporter [Albidovulum sp.]
MHDLRSAEITHKRVLGIAIPIVVSNATIPVLGAVDTAVVGQLGTAAPIGAVGIGSIIVTTVYWLFGFLRMGISGMTSQARGRSDTAEISALICRSLVFGFAVGLFLVAMKVPITRAAFMISPASQDVESLAGNYTSIRFFSAPAAIAIYGITGWLIAQERTRSVLLLQIWMNGLNIALDFLFVLVLERGVAGVAEATLIAEWSGLALGIWICRDGIANGAWRNFPQIFDFAKIKRMATINADIMIRSAILEVAFLSFLFYGASFGDVTLAANQVLLQFLHITAYALDGFAFAAEALVGLAIGARTRLALRRAVILASFWSVIMVLLLSSVFLIAGPYIIDLMAKSQEVRTESRQYYLWIVAGPLTGVAAWLLDGIFVGAMRTRDMRNAMLLALIAYGISAWVFVEPLENNGLWLSLMIFNLSRGIALGIRYLDLERMQ